MKYRIYASIIMILLLVSTSGCILDTEDDTIIDTDGDGVQDKYDACPNLAGDPTNQGCPSTTVTAPPSTMSPTTSPPTGMEDSDGDGVTDTYDACPNIAGDPSNHGCPLPETEAPQGIVDTDGDGVQDQYDACPDIPGNPANQGCPLPETEPPETYVDTDGDGVQDQYDACPEIAGDPTNQGCPTQEEPNPTNAPTWTFTAIPTITISPTILYYQWLGKWESDGSTAGISELWIVLDDESKLDVHVFVDALWFKFYLGHFNPVKDGDYFVGTLEYSDRTEDISLSLDSGIMAATRFTDYGSGNTYEQVTELTRTDSVVLNDSNYIESYSGSWFAINNTGRVKNLYIVQTAPNMLDVTLTGNCIPTPCDWGTHSVYFNPSQAVKFEFQDGYYTRSFELFIDGSELEVFWEFEHSGGGISAAVENFFKLIPIYI